MTFISSAQGRLSWFGDAAIVGYICLSLAYFHWGWSDDISEFGGDSSMYMLIARNLSPFYPDSTVLSQAVQGTTYPPLFPLLIGLLGGSMLAAHLLVVATLLTAVWCLYAWLRHEGLGLGISAWTAGLFALMPGTYFPALNILTENPYLLLSLVAILTESHAGLEGERRPALRWVAAAVVAAATLVRAAALPLLAAFVIRLLITRPRRWPWLIAASVLPFLLWAAWSKLHHAGVSGYVSQWSSIYADDPIAAFRAQVGMESGRVLRAWTKAWMGQGGVAALAYLVAAIGLVCLLGCLRRLAELRFDAIYVVLYVMLLLVWPFSGEASRLSYPLLPVLLAQGLLLVHRLCLGGNAPLLRLLPALLLGLLTLGILPALVLTARRFNDPLPPELAAARRTESFYLGDQQQSIQAAQSFTKTLHGLKEIDHFVTSENCIFAVKPSVITLYSGRSSYLPPFSSSTDESFERGIDQCRYAYLLAIVTTTFNQSLYPLQRLGDRTQPLVLEFAPSGDGSSRDVFAALVEIGPP